MIKQEAKFIYSKIDRTWCPALNDYVEFNSRGFRHLIRKGRLLRSDSEQKRRFVLISDAPKIINSTITIAEHRVEMNKYVLKCTGRRKCVLLIQIFGR